MAIREPFSRLGVLLGFSPISLHNLLRATSDGFRSWVSRFFLLRLPIVCSTFSSVVFYLDFDPLFFLLLFPCKVFSFIYLFIYN